VLAICPKALIERMAEKAADEKRRTIALSPF
jgi:hypothetical protein